MKKIGLVVKPDEAVRQRADKFETWLNQKSVDVVRRDISSPDPAKAGEPHPFAPPDLSCVFVLGGDGTFRGADAIANQHTSTDEYSFTYLDTCSYGRADLNPRANSHIHAYCQ